MSDIEFWKSTPAKIFALLHYHSSVENPQDVKNKKLNNQINDEKDADGLSDLDKIEMNNSKFDESYIIMGSINIKQNIKRLKRKFDVEFREGEVDYYISNLRLNKIQKDLIFQFYASYFGGLRDSYDAPRKQLAKLIIIMKESIMRLISNIKREIISIEFALVKIFKIAKIMPKIFSKVKVEKMIYKIIMITNIIIMKEMLFQLNHL